MNKKTPKEIIKLMKQREELRKNKEWQKSDEVRKEIEKKGYLLEDTKDGTVVRVV